MANDYIKRRLSEEELKIIDCISPKYQKKFASLPIFKRKQMMKQILNRLKRQGYDVSSFEEQSSRKGSSLGSKKTTKKIITKTLAANPINGTVKTVKAAKYIKAQINAKKAPLTYFDEDGTEHILKNKDFKKGKYSMNKEGFVFKNESKKSQKNAKKGYKKRKKKAKKNDPFVRRKIGSALDSILRTPTAKDKQKGKTINELKAQQMEKANAWVKNKLGKKAGTLLGKIILKILSLLISLVASLLPVILVVVVIIVIIVLIVSIFSFLFSADEEEKKQKSTYAESTLSENTLALSDKVIVELKKYNKEDYLNLCLAIIQQESNGQGNNPMQVNGATSVDDSIQKGVKMFCGYMNDNRCKVKSTTDMEPIKVCLQTYNMGSGYISYVTKKGKAKYTQQSALDFQKIHGKGTRSGNAADNLGPYNYGDAYYVPHVLRYYSDGSIGGASVKKVSGIDENKRMNYLFPNGVPTTESEMSKYLTRLRVPYYDGSKKKKYMHITVHKSLAKAYTQAFEGMFKIHFKVLPGETAAYCWRHMASGTGSLSHHSYGVAIDVNSSHNTPPYQGNYYYPLTDKLSIPQPVVMIWKNAGFYWGGDWSGYYKDYMHFTYTNH